MKKEDKYVLFLLSPFILYAGIMSLWLFGAFVLNPIARATDGYTPYMDEECYHFLAMSSTTSIYLRNGEHSYFPSELSKCKPERNYNFL